MGDVDILTETIEETDSAIDTFGSFNLLQEDETIEEVDGFQVRSVLRSSGSRSFSPASGNVWVLESGNTTYNVLFPKTEYLEVQDGYLVNTGSNNITGVVLDSNGIDLSDFFENTVTILPLYSSSSQNTAYRYGSHSYLTHYSTNNGNTLVTSVSYNDFAVVKKPFGFSISVSNSIIIALLLISVVISIMGGLLRR